MTRVNPNAMMFATVSGCAQTACVRSEKPADKKAGKLSGKSAKRRVKKRAKTSRSTRERS